MGKIGQFIDRCVEREPDLMRRVHDRPWGTLGEFIEFDSEGQACGCLVGAIGLEKCGESVGRNSAIHAASRVAGVHFHVANDIGCDVWGDLCARVAGIVRSDRDDVYFPFLPEEAELRTIAMLKARIARRLREHEGRAFVRDIAAINPLFKQRVALARVETQ